MNIDKLTRTLAKFLGTTELELLDGFRTAKFDELREISELRAPALNDAQRFQDISYLEWRFFERDEGATDLWICKPQDELLAIVGLERMDFVKGDQEHDFIRIIDLYVAPELQKFGVAPWMCLRVKTLFPRILVIGSNENSLSVTQKLWPSINILNKYKKPLGLDGVFTGSQVFSYLTQFRVVKRLAVKIIRLTMQRKLNALSKNTVLTVYESPSELGRAIDLQDANLGPATERMQTKRNADFIGWRFEQHPTLEFRASALLDKDGKMLAYLVASAAHQQVEGKDVAMQRTYLVDWRTFDNTPDSLANLILEYCLHASRQGTYVVEAQTTDCATRNAMQLAGFWARERDARFFVYDRDQDWSKSSNDDWVITWADTDQIDQIEDHEIS